MELSKELENQKLKIKNKKCYKAYRNQIAK